MVQEGDRIRRGASKTMKILLKIKYDIFKLQIKKHLIQLIETYFLHEYTYGIEQNRNMYLRNQNWLLMYNHKTLYKISVY